MICYYMCHVTMFLVKLLLISVMSPTLTQFYQRLCCALNKQNTMNKQCRWQVKICKSNYSLFLFKKRALITQCGAMFVIYCDNIFSLPR